MITKEPLQAITSSQIPLIFSFYSSVGSIVPAQKSSQYSAGSAVPECKHLTELQSSPPLGRARPVGFKQGHFNWRSSRSALRCRGFQCVEQIRIVAGQVALDSGVLADSPEIPAAYRESENLWLLSRTPN